MAGSTKRKMPLKKEIITNFPYLMYVHVGDVSNDGHGMHDRYLFRTNVEPKKILASYLKACKTSGVYLHDDSKTANKKKIACDYEDDQILPEVMEKLEKFGIDISFREDWDERIAGIWDYLFMYDAVDNLSISEKGCAFLLLEMARVQLLKDGITLIFREEFIPTVNEHFQIGYGCYHG